MPKITDYVREGFKKRRRPWEHTELPEWWDVVIWVSLGGVIVAVVLGAALGGGGSKGIPAADSPRYAVQSLNPYATPTPGTSITSVPTPGVSPVSSASPTPDPGDSSGGTSATDFSATAAVQVAQTGGGTAIVPAGARNVAVAAARAEATGDWTGIPLAVSGKRPTGPKTPQGTVTGTITVENPAVTGSGSYVFSATVTHDGTAKPYLVQIAVERAASGYVVRPR